MHKLTFVLMIAFSYGFSISGQIFSLEGEEHVLIPADSIRLFADEWGRYTIRNLDEVSYDVSFSMIGYRDTTISISLPADSFIITYLSPETTTFTNIKRKTPDYEIFKRDVNTLRWLLRANEIQDFSPFRSDDPIFFIRKLPGVNSFSDFFSTQPLVRGKSPDETPILLDGAPIYNLYLGGFTAVFTVHTSNTPSYIQLQTSYQSLWV